MRGVTKRYLYLTIIVIGALLLSFFYYTTQNKRASQLHKAEQFLINKVTQDQYGTECISSNRSNPCIINNTGQVMTALFIASALKFDGSIPHKVSAALKSMLARGNRGNVWGYATISPIETDSSSFALRTLLLLGETPNIHGMNNFYNEKYNAYSAFTSKNNEKPVTEVTLENTEAGIHSEVNVNAFSLLESLGQEEKVNVKLIESFQHANGAWDNFFYTGNYYSTYIALSLLCKLGTSDSAVKKGIHYITSTQNNDGSWGHPGNSYDTALALGAMLDCGAGSKESIKKAASYLYKHQEENGSWSYSSSIWSFVHARRAVYPKNNSLASRQINDYWTFYDSENVMTTALALLALKKYEIYIHHH